KARMQPLARKQPTVALPAHTPLRPRDVTWIEPKLVAELEYRRWGKEGLLRQASLKGLREDKTVDEVGKGKGKAVKKTATRKKAGRPPADEAPRISSPDRVVYAGLKITKQQVADYYQAVAPLLLPELRERPLSMVRCPDGIAGQCFFQKHHAASLGDNVRAVPIREKGGGRDDYVYVDS